MMDTKRPSFCDLSVELQLQVFEEVQPPLPSDLLPTSTNTVQIYNSNPEDVALASFRLMSHAINTVVTPIRYRRFRLQTYNTKDPAQAAVRRDAYLHARHIFCKEMVWPGIATVFANFTLIESLHIKCSEPLHWISSKSPLLPPVTELSVRFMTREASFRSMEAPWNFSFLKKLELHSVPFEKMFPGIRENETPEFPLLEVLKITDESSVPLWKGHEIDFPSPMWTVSC